MILTPQLYTNNNLKNPFLNGIEYDMADTMTYTSLVLTIYEIGTGRPEVISKRRYFFLYLFPAQKNKIRLS